MGYEWYQSGGHVPEIKLSSSNGRRATKAELLNFFRRLEDELTDCGFLGLPHMRSIMVRNIRNIFQRAHLLDQEVRTLHGIVTALSKGRRDKQ